ncbi:MAG: bifunctional phosphopantothenoylcysteine decarboxylase/phosphopantothenate--cysteine ligase CoaBC [Desulfarculus sp.]|nr:bifunctional phosphopantothenoylcysteine decarboxylase/phosphopantothenate--cysteine ligase CoaBC [Desulfarculus sp.]
MNSGPEPPRVLLGITGGIAAYKACELASLLTQRGISVRAVMTAGARNFVGPLTMAALTGNPVAETMFDPGQEAAISHIELARWASAVVVAPATANFVAKAAWGLADDLLSTLILATKAPLLLAPAMNIHMYAHPTVAENLARLAARGVRTVGPGLGRTACGEEGLGRMAEPLEIAEELYGLLSPQDLAGVRLLVSAGPTREHLDPVRYLSNPSSGRMGIEIARVARRRGAEVTLVLGPTHLAPPAGVKAVRVTSAAQMHQAVIAEADKAQVVVKAAAVSDFTPLESKPHKVKKKAGQGETVDLTHTTDILAELGRDKAGRLLVGFAAETTDVLAHAAMKLKAKNLDLLVANDVSDPQSGFAVSTNRVHFLFADGAVEALPLLTKEEVAGRLLDRVAALLGLATA